MLRTLLLVTAVASTMLVFGHEVTARGGRGGRGGCGGGSCGGGSGGCYSGGGYSGCGGGGCYTGMGGGCVGGGCGSGICAIPVAPAQMQMASASPATLVVSLPADAVLTVDGQATNSTSSVRVFHTPVLETGADYAYTLRAEVVRDGQSQLIVRQVTLRAGQETRVSLTESAASVAAAE
jgi:uncharacterized protein (TIGR03000 family)